ncbi:MAG TPA: TatD family hydrolase [Kiritimatiellia bacterium]|mgnify:CR=1 FL=1|nr:TatD family hydrolase [Kiritimatiellia bacterium]
MFDAHTHLQSPLLSGVLARVIDDAARAGVTGVCCCATVPDDWPAVAELARVRLPFVLVPAFGVHPWHVQGLPSDWPGRLAALLDAHPVAAVGEIGLDGLRDDVPADLQDEVFLRQLDIAERLRRPVILHGARAWGRLAERITPFARRLPGVVVHGFSGSAEILKQLLNVGAYVSFAGSVYNPMAAKVRAAVRDIPDSQMLIETDTPDLFPEGGVSAATGANGKPLNQPANLRRVLEEVARLRNATPEAISDLTGANARRVLL